MYGEQLLNMDPYMLLSILNMKLRDKFDSLDTLCDDFDIEKQEVNRKLKEIGYKYNENINRFISVDEY
jgi:hypothetical protein